MMDETTTEITDSSDYKQIKLIIKSELESLTEGFISLGYYLKKCRDGNLYREGGYSDIFEFAEAEYNLGKSTASRFMSINDKFSIEGNSPEIDPAFRGYGSSKLAEMLTLPEEAYARVTADSTIAEIREIKHEIKEAEDKLQVSIFDFPEYLPDEKKTIDAGYDIADFLKQNGGLIDFIDAYFEGEGKAVFEKVVKAFINEELPEVKAQIMLYAIAPSKYRVISMPAKRIICTAEDITIMAVGGQAAKYKYEDAIKAFAILFNPEPGQQAEEVYKTHYGRELHAVPVKVEIRPEPKMPENVINTKCEEISKTEDFPKIESMKEDFEEEQEENEEETEEIDKSEDEEEATEPENSRCDVATESAIASEEVESVIKEPETVIEEPEKVIETEENVINTEHEPELVEAEVVHDMHAMRIDQLQFVGIRMGEIPWIISNRYQKNEDVITLIETIDGRNTGREIKVKVKNVTRSHPGLKDGYCICSIKKEE